MLPAPRDQPGVALINGASRGIGFEAAARLAEDGWRVAITARKPDPLEEAAEDLRSRGAEVISFAGAVDDEEHQRRTVDAIMSRWGRIDALVNNVAISPHLGDVLDATNEQFSKGMDINVIAPFAWIRLVWEASMRERGGSVVNVASIGGTYPVPRVGLYNVSKAALIHLTKQLALELAPGVRVNAVAPATIKTRFSRAKYEGREDEVAEQYPLKRLGRPEEVGDVIAMLCNGRIGWVTGQTITIDGGASMIQGVV